MFTDKLQNPFLKPSPFAGSTTSHTASYTNSNLPPRYPSYKPYEEPKSSYMEPPPRYTNYDRPSVSPKAFESKDIDSILNKNPFNRSFQPSFAIQRQSRDLSPGRSSNKLFDPIASRNNYQDYSSALRSYDNSNVSSSSNGRINETPSRMTPSRNNYLSTSSADSATTYINRVYDLEEDKNTNRDSKPLSNPFFRKSLLPNTINERQTNQQNDYDSVALKYAGYAYQQNRSKSPSLGQESYDFNYESRPEQGNKKSFQKGVSFSREYQQEYGGSYEGYKDKYQNIPSKDEYRGFREDRVGQKIGQGPSYQSNYQERSYDRNKYSDKAQSYEEKRYQEPNFGNKYSDPYPMQSMNYDKPESNKYIDKYKDYSKDDYKSSWKEEKQSASYQPSYKDPYRSKGQKRQEFNSRGEEERMRFSEKSQEESNYGQYNGNMARFDTLGGVQRSREYDYNPREPDPTSFATYPKEPHKFTSSQVDQYTTPEDMERKIKDSKYEKLGIINPSKIGQRKSPTNIVRFENDNQEFEHPSPTLGKAPTRDSSQDYPRILQINGTLFHKVEVM